MDSDLDTVSEQERQAFISSLRLLTASPKSRRGLKEKLEEKGYGRDVIEKTLVRLERQGVLNDRRFAEGVLQKFSTERASGRRRVMFEMKKKGVPSNLAAEVLGRYTSEEERLRGIEIALQRSERLRRLGPQRRKKRLYDFLLRRGFDYAVARDIVSEVTKKGES